LKRLVTIVLIPAALFATEPKRASGLSVHMLPDSVAEISGEQGGFMATDPISRQRTQLFTNPTDLLTYFQNLPRNFQDNGIWVVTTNPDAYSLSEQGKLADLKTQCRAKGIPLFTCRGSELPNGWLAVK